jgi:hypothetical protein
MPNLQRIDGVSKASSSTCNPNREDRRPDCPAPFNGARGSGCKVKLSSRRHLSRGNSGGEFFANDGCDTRAQELNGT